MVTVDWCFHPFEGIVLAGVLFALYYWVIRLRCQARMAQVFIFVSVLATGLCTFTALDIEVKSDKPADDHPTVLQAIQQQAIATEEANGSIMSPTYQSPDDDSWQHVPQLPYSRLFLWCYALGVVAVVASFVVQMLWYWRLRKESIIETEDDGIKVFSSPYATPFSFLRNVFLPSDLDDEVRRYALMHEKCHIRHHHFFKLCFMLMMVALNWFNPFVWMFFIEMKVQHELEVDADVLAEGADRREYQMSLLKVCVQNSRWLMVQSAFGAKSLKQRIIFMNKKLNRRPSILRMAACMMALTLVFVTAMAVRAQFTVAVIHHPLEGCWTMDFTRPANTDQKLYPPFKQYAFYNHNTFFTPHFYKLEGTNFYFGFSGEEVVMRNDTLVNAHGEPLIYRFVKDGTFQCDWKKAATDNSLAQGEVITDQWSKATPPDEVLLAFRNACDAGRQRQKPFDGVWQLESSDTPGKSISFVLANGNLMMAIDYIPDPNASIYRYSGGGVSAEITMDNGKIVAKFMGATIVMEDNNHAVMHQEGNDKSTRLKRVDMPPYIQRMLETTKVEAQ